MEKPESALPGTETTTYSTSLGQGTVTAKWQGVLAECKYMLLTKDGWIGDYVCYKNLIIFIVA